MRGLLGLLAAILVGCASSPSTVPTTPPVVVPPVTVPLPPGGLSESFLLKWQAPAALAGVTIAGYNVYMGQTPTTLAKVNETGLVTDTTYAVKGMALGVYYWAVSAVSTAGAESAKTSPVTGSIL